MIAKLPKKDIIALVYITILTGVALWYGFTSVPSPEKQRDIVYDQTRMNNVNAIQTAVADYYTQKNALPMRLDDLQVDSFASSDELFDPQTNQQYEYATTSETEYKICATFATDSKQQKDTNRNVYYSDSDKQNHPQGYYCFTNTVLPKETLTPIWNPKDDTYTPFGSESAEPSTSKDEKTKKKSSESVG